MEIQVLSDEDKEKLFKMSLEAKKDIEGIIKEEMLAATKDLKQEEDMER